MNLVVKSAFGNYKLGQAITDQSVITEILGSANERHVLKVADLPIPPVPENPFLELIKSAQSSVSSGLSGTSSSVSSISSGPSNTNSSVSSVSSGLSTTSSSVSSVSSGLSQ